MNDSSRQLEKSNLLRLSGTNLDRDAVDVWKWVRQNFELLPVNSNFLRHSVTELLDLLAHVVGWKTALGRKHKSFFPARGEQFPPSLLNREGESCAVIAVTTWEWM